MLLVLGFTAGQQLDVEVALAAGELALAGCLDWARNSTSRWPASRLPSPSRRPTTTNARPTSSHRPDPCGTPRGCIRASFPSTSSRACGRSALGAGDLDLADATSRELLRRCALIDYEPFRCWGRPARAQLAEARARPERRDDRMHGRAGLGARLGLAHYLSFTLAECGRIAALAGDVPRADAALAEAIDTAEQAGAGWFAAFARVALADVRRTPATARGPRLCCGRWSIGARGPSPGPDGRRSPEVGWRPRGDGGRAPDHPGVRASLSGVDTGGSRPAHGRACSSWAGQPEQRGLVAEAAEEVHADRQAVARSTTAAPTSPGCR